MELDRDEQTSAESVELSQSFPFSSCAENGSACGHSLERNRILDHRASFKLLQMSPQPSFHPGKNGLEWF